MLWLYLLICLPLIVLLYLVMGRSKPMPEFRERGRAKHPIVLNLGTVRFLRINGYRLKVAAKIINSFLGSLSMSWTRRQSNLDLFERLKLVDPPTLYPIEPPSDDQKKLRHVTDEELQKLADKTVMKRSSFDFTTLSELAQAYRSGALDPVYVAEKAIQAITASERHSPQLRWLVQWDKARIMQMAVSSAKRFASGELPLSVMDGIPVVIKEEFSVVPFHTRHGTQFMGKEPSTSDSTIVAKLRKGGAVILGLANMHELGLGITGNNCNKHHGTARNPYNTDHHTGGSSSGVAAAVAGGFAPIGLGTDAGGSIRIPSSFCGCVGLKATFGRISPHAADESCACPSVIHAGPICATVKDAAILYGFIAGKDPHYREGLDQPPVSLAGFDNITSLDDLRIGIDWEYFKLADSEVTKVCKRAMNHLIDLGATIVPIQIPELEEARVAHMITTISEMGSSYHADIIKHGEELNPDTHLLLLSGNKSFSSSDYFQAQRQRTRCMKFLKDIFEKVDCILTPSTPNTAPAIRPETLEYGEVNSEQLARCTRYTFLTNFSGNPSLVLPVGYDSASLPIAMQITGNWWDEHVILRIGNALEQSFERQKPQVHFSLMD